jgi:Cdc6-like AAA superfamily ATPase
VSNRREIWRDFMGRFEPSGDPRDAVGRGFYVPRPGRSLAEQLAARFELKPAASHLLMGGVGSGKTTQFLVARDRLEAAGDVNAVYVDVSLRVEPNAVIAGDLLVAVGLALGEQLEPRPRSSATNEALAVLGEGGYLDDGRLTPAALAEHVAVIRRELSPSRPHHIVLIDALDRMSDLDRFADLIDGDVPALRFLGLGVILVGPLTALYGIRRAALERFDRTWHLPTVDVQNDAEGHTFLQQVLHARDGHRLLTGAAAERLAAFSGGVLRDLIALTQTAGEEAYVDGADQVEVRHVEAAAEIFGRKQLVALDSQELAVLQRVRTRGTFVQTSEKDLAQLATRRVLEYTNGQARFAVHPTIEPLLAQIAEAP